MKVYKVELLIVDRDNVGADEIKSVLEDTRYPNWCVSPNVMKIDHCDIEWSDDHPLNYTDKMDQAYQELFGL